MWMSSFKITTRKTATQWADDMVNKIQYEQNTKLLNLWPQQIYYGSINICENVLLPSKDHYAMPSTFMHTMGQVRSYVKD